MKVLKKLVQFFDKKYWKYVFQYFFLSVFVYFVGCIAPYINSGFSLADFNEYGAEAMIFNIGEFFVVFIFLGVLFIFLFSIILFVFFLFTVLYNRLLAELKETEV